MRRISFADSQNILNRWNIHVSRLLNVDGISDVGQTEIHAYEP